MSIVKTKMRNGTELLIETEDEWPLDEYQVDAYRGEERGRKKIVESGKNLIQDAMSGIQSCADELVSGLNALEKKLRPDEIEAHLAFKLTAEAGAIITKIGGEAQLQVKITWKNLN